MLAPPDMPEPQELEALLAAFKRAVKAKIYWKSKVRDPALPRKYVEEAECKHAPETPANLPSTSHLARNFSPPPASLNTGLPPDIAKVALADLMQSGCPPVNAPLPVDRIALEAATLAAQRALLPTVSVPFPDIFERLRESLAPPVWKLRVQLSCDVCQDFNGPAKANIWALCGDPSSRISCRLLMEFHTVLRNVENVFTLSRGCRALLISARRSEQADADAGSLSRLRAPVRIAPRPSPGISTSGWTAFFAKSADGPVPSTVRDLLAWHLDAIASRDDRDFRPGSEGKLAEYPEADDRVPAIYRWLLNKFYVDAGGLSQITSYINGLNPRGIV
ncbi:hypothetical protein BDK51DRAFT_41055 [Blyttiomyces helicus]|uniref:Uncharacterized protein n=1 Tax=Blyttiomyces helicus TaxID=388810 RepID=A0A4P9WCL9_9FUNG|nr:hypothetical protein BDK51DRAFT_41055 [Blyttiomyces helicus]|eukprot:RKO90072.1 hypothetical protein BDK51DRAFT_41055 [Blyttiomyces helicus]